MKNYYIILLILVSRLNFVSAQCAPEIVSNVSTGCAPLQVLFNCPNVSTGTLSWSNGTTTVTGASVNFIFLTPGTYTVTLTAIIQGALGTCTGTATKMITVVMAPPTGCPPTVGLNELHQENLLIYPNPNYGSFNIQRHTYHEDDRIMIMNLMGQVVLDEKLGSRTTITCPSLDKGTYILKLFQNQNVANHLKLIIE